MHERASHGSYGDAESHEIVLTAQCYYSQVGDRYPLGHKLSGGLPWLTTEDPQTLATSGEVWDMSGQVSPSAKVAPATAELPAEVLELEKNPTAGKTPIGKLESFSDEGRAVCTPVAC